MPLKGEKRGRRLPLRVLIVDDHGIVRDGLKQILVDKFPGAIIGEARSGVDAIGLVSIDLWDLVLLDISMPGQNGLDVLKQLKAIQPAIKVLVLTMHPEDQYAIRVLRAGASGYLTKDTASGEVVNAVDKLLAGGTYLSSSLAENLASNLGSSGGKAPHETLSDREYQVLRMLGVGKTVKEIGFDLSLSIKTVSTYRTRVLKKLKLKSNGDIIRYTLREKLVD